MNFDYKRDSVDNFNNYSKTYVLKEGLPIGYPNGYPLADNESVTNGVLRMHCLATGFSAKIFNIKLSTTSIDGLGLYQMLIMVLKNRTYSDNYYRYTLRCTFTNN